MILSLFNCRCYDRYGYGIFWRAYFQCEPGTHFSDQLDQCVFQGDNRGCAVYPSTVCQESYQQCAMTNICPATDSGKLVMGYTLLIVFSISAAGMLYRSKK